MERVSWAGYGAPKDVMPLGGYAVLVSAFSAGLAGFLAWATRSRRLPDRIAPADALLLGVGTHKLTRLITKDWVTSPVRAPFVEFKGSSQIPGEVREKSRGHGLRRAIGDLLTCEICIAPWIAAGLLATHSVNPRLSRFLAGLFATVAVSDFMNQAYTAAAMRAHSIVKRATTTDVQTRQRARPEQEAPEQPEATH